MTFVRHSRRTFARSIFSRTLVLTCPGGGMGTPVPAGKGGTPVLSWLGVRYTSLVLAGGRSGDTPLLSWLGVLQSCPGWGIPLF